MKFRFLILFFVGLLLVSSVFGAEYQLKRASEVSVGDVIVASDGSEILVEKIDYGRSSSEGFVKEKSKSIMDVIWGKVSGESMTGFVVAGGNSELGLSLGEGGTGIKVYEGEVPEVAGARTVREQVSFWNRLMFWRNWR